MLAPILFLLVLVSGCAARGEPVPELPPNIVVFLADDLGWGDVGYHGGQIDTPTIDRLAREGTRLEGFYVQPVCSPTRSALLTGRYPIRTGTQVGVIRPFHRTGVPKDERFLSRALHECGYETAICGKWHLGFWKREWLPTSRGFEHQFGHYCGAIDYFKLSRNGGADWHRDDEPLTQKGYTTDLIADECVRLIEKRDQNRPLFLYVAFNAPHTPLQAPQKWIDRYAERIKQPRRQKFAAMVSCMDAAMARVLAALDANGMRDNTLVLFFSDNGGARGTASSGALRGTKGTLFEGGVRAPCIARWPGKIEPGKAVAEMLHVVDLYPTLVGVAGGTLAGCKPLDGKDAWSTIARGAPSPRDEILHNVAPNGAAIRMGDWKLVHLKARPNRPNRRNRRNRRNRAAQRESWMLFDLANDPNEKKDVASQHADRLDRMKKRLAHFEAVARKPLGSGGGRANDPVPKIWAPLR